jgi:hypothetical protein
MCLEVGDANRLKCPRAHVQGQEGELYPAFAQSFEQRPVEVQPCGGRGYCAGGARVHGLIARRIFEVRWPPDVGRQWHAADSLQYF